MRPRWTHTQTPSCMINTVSCLPLICFDTCLNAKVNNYAMYYCIIKHTHKKRRGHRCQSKSVTYIHTQAHYASVLQFMLRYECILCVSVPVWYCVCVLGHEVITLCRACVFSAGFPLGNVPSPHCTVDHPAEFHRLQWTLLCLPQPWGSFGPYQKPAISQGHFRVTSKVPSESSFDCQKISHVKDVIEGVRDAFSFFKEDKIHPAYAQKRC